MMNRKDFESPGFRFKKREFEQKILELAQQFEKDNSVGIETIVLERQRFASGGNKIKEINLRLFIEDDWGNIYRP